MKVLLSIIALCIFLHPEMSASDVAIAHSGKCASELKQLEKSPAKQRLVTCSNKDSNGTITAIGGPSWGVVSKKKAMEHINNHEYHYYVLGKNGQKVPVIVKAYISACPDGSITNNLSSLPACPTEP